MTDFSIETAPASQPVEIIGLGVTAPKFVRVGFKSLRVVFLDAINADAAGVYGFYDPVAGEIRIRRDTSPQECANTFIHEVMHVIHQVYGLRDESTEEEFTTLGANGLCAFSQDNPEAMLWWQNLLAGAKLVEGDDE